MEKIPLNLADLCPQDATFTLSTHPGKAFTLCRWSLRVRAWASAQYGDKKIQQIFAEQQIVEIAEMAYFMLRDRTAFPTHDDFMEAIVTTQDQINILKALLQAVGIGEPEIKKINDSLPKGLEPDPKSKTPIGKKKKIGAKSLTR